jgi:hypothetical protein
MEHIVIYDNFLSNLDMKQCLQIVKESKWEYGHISDVNNITSIPFWYMELIDNDFLKDIIKKKIEYITKKKFTLVRLYANGQTYGQDGVFHQDDTSLDSYTFCLYCTEISPDISDLVGGHIEFILPESTHSINIKTIFNRGIFFPSHYFHRGLAFNRYVCDLRICIAWKLKENHN